MPATSLGIINQHPTSRRPEASSTDDAEAFLTHRSNVAVNAVSAAVVFVTAVANVLFVVQLL